MLNFNEWKKKKAIKNSGIESFIKSVDVLKKDLEELDTLEKKKKEKPDFKSYKKDKDANIKNKKDDKDNISDKFDNNSSNKSSGLPTNDRISKQSDKSRTKSDSPNDSGKKPVESRKSDTDKID